jgi:hypothetical protein
MAQRNPEGDVLCSLHACICVGQQVYMKQLDSGPRLHALCSHAAAGKPANLTNGGHSMTGVGAWSLVLGP